jgi:hypothetical protein
MNLVKVQEILNMQPHAGKPSQAICNIITGLKELCDLQGTGNVDWRRGGVQANFRGPVKQLPRNTSSLSIQSPIQRTPSNRSFGSASSPSSSTSPGGFNAVGTSGGHSPMRYQSKFKNSSKPVQDKILNNIILSKLNKFSLATYVDVRDFLYQILGSGEPDLGEMVRQFMLLVFKKAASEEKFCSLYAKLLAEISTRYKVILEEMHILQSNYLEIFDDIEEVPEGGDNYDTFVEKNRDKQYRQGYSQFLAELAGLEILELSHFEQTFKKLAELMFKYAAIPEKKTLVDEYADCLLRMTRVLKKKSTPFFISAKTSLLAICKDSIDILLVKKEHYQSLSAKGRFILMDVKDNLTLT